MSVALGVLHRFDRAHVTSASHLAAFAHAVEEFGVESVWVGEHVAIAADYEPAYPYSSDGRMRLRDDTVLPDPFEWLAFVAALTSTVKLGTGTIILPLHPPVMLAKRVATLDALSDGRVLLGVGTGWQREEYDALNVDFDARGRIADDSIGVLRCLWSEREASYDGAFVRFDRLQSEPKPRHGSVPILIGGSSRPAARRAGRLGDGWYPSADLGPEELATGLDVVRAAARDAGRSCDGFDVTVRPSMGRPGALFDRDRVQAFVDAGATRVVISMQEVEGTDTEALRRMLGEYQERVVGRIT